MAYDKVVDSAVLDGYFSDIADAIRDKDGTQNTYTPAQMPQAIEDIPSGGGDTLADVLLNKTATEYINNTFTSSVSDYCFYKATSLQTVKIPNASGISQYAFYQCTALEEVDFSSATVIGGNAFTMSFVNTSDLSFPNVTNINTGAFASSNLRNISVPKLTSVANTTFYNCRNLQSITIPLTLTSGVSMNMFGGCSSLQSAVFGGHIPSIAAKAFGGCTSCLLYDFSNCTSVPTLANIDAFNNINANAKIVVPDDLYNTWVAASNWVTYASYIIKKSDYDAL